MSNSVPYGGAGSERSRQDIYLRDRAEQEAKTLAPIDGADVSPWYCRTMRIPLVRGRFFHATDTTSSEPVIIISERAARLFWPGQDPIGRSLSWGRPTAQNPWTRVVGIVGNVRQHKAEGDNGAELYYPLTQGPVATTYYGKTTLLRRVFPSASYRLLEDPAVLAAARSDPRGFLDEIALPAILDEIQNAPELLNFIRARIDATPRRRGQWLLTGSQDFALMRGVSESMAGRAAVLQLLPLSVRESSAVTRFRGGFPEVLARPRDASLWFQSYMQTYIERDVRQISQIRDLATFRRFLALVASRSGQLLNRTDLAAPLGMSIPGLGEWLSILETTGQIILVHPYFENFGKRLIKSPKVYMADPGLACHLLGLESERELARSPFAGAIFEGFVAAEIVKQQINQGRRRELYFFRDQRGLEVDFVVPVGSRGLTLLEAKATRTVYPAAAKSLASLAAAIGDRRTQSAVVHAGDTAATALAPGIRALDVVSMLDLLQSR